MEQTESTFKFNQCTINRCRIEYPASQDYSKKLKIDIKPSGTIEANIFHLTLMVTITNSEQNLIIEITAVGAFEFTQIPSGPLNDLFIINAPAIMFPYIRSYISAVTALSGHSTITLPTLNMSSLSKELSENITNK